MFKLNSTILQPLRIKRKPIIIPVYILLFLVMLFLFVPGIASYFIKDERAFAIGLLIFWLIMLPIVIVSVIVVCAIALSKKNSVFRFIPEAPDGAVFKWEVLFDFESKPGEILYSIETPDELKKTTPPLTVWEDGKVKKGPKGFYRVTNLTVNHDYRVAMILAIASGIGPGGRYGLTGTLQCYWIIFIEEEYDKLMSAIREHNVNLKTSVKSDLEAQYIVDGIKIRIGQ